MHVGVVFLVGVHDGLDHLPRPLRVVAVVGCGSRDIEALRKLSSLRIGDSISSGPLPHVLMRDYDHVRVCDVERRTILRKVHLHDIVLAGL